MIDPILARTAPLFADAVRRYLAGGTPAAFERAMQQALAQAHTAAYLRGVAERLGVSVSTLKGFSRAERAELRTALREQFKFLGAFVEQLGGMSEAQVAARAGLYAASAKATYWQAWAGVELECTPGGCPECYTRCRCALDRRADGIYWTGPGDAHSCGACRGRIGRRMDK